MIVQNNKFSKLVNHYFPLVQHGNLFVTIFLLCASTKLMAQSLLLEEIVVTAQKRAQSVQDVPIAISAFTGEQLDAFGFEASYDVAKLTPGVHVGGSFAGLSQQFTIRGVTQNDVSDHVESPVAVYIDEGYVSLSQAQTFAMFDVDRVEVLKGPQGTLFGRNATGGLAHFITRKPTFDSEGYGKFTAASSNQLGFEGAVSGPLNNQLAGRMAVLFNEHDGYLNNKYTAVDGVAPGAGAGADLGGVETKAIRTALVFEPSQDLTLSGSVSWARSNFSTGPYQSKPVLPVYQVADDGSLVYVNLLDVAPTETRFAVDPNGVDLIPTATRPVPGGDYFGYLDPDGEGTDTVSDFAFDEGKGGSNETWGINAKVEWALSESSTLSMITDYKNYENLQQIDIDSTGLNFLAAFAQADQTSFSQEIRLNGEADRSRWVAGFYYLNIDNESGVGVIFPQNAITLAPSFVPFFSLPREESGDVALETDSYSIFGQGEYDLTDSVTFTAGLRLIQEDKDFDWQQNVYASTSPTDVRRGLPIANWPVPLRSFSGDSSDTLWAGKIQLDWRPADDLLLYAGINRGVKAGSFNGQNPGLAGSQAPDSLIPYDEEVLISYEGGFKSTIFGGSTHFNGSIFYYDYQDYQAFLFLNQSGIVLNNDVNNYGAELEIVTSPISGLDVLLNVSWFDATVEDLEIGFNTGIFRDVDPTYAPEFQVSGAIRYEWSFLEGVMALSGDFIYSDEFYYNLRNFDADKFDSYLLGNVRLAWTDAQNNWELAFFVRNIGDVAAGVQGFDDGPACGCNEVSYQKPRWMGGSVKYSF